ncbi:hypothetical protein CC78DRAFT_212373 [Lojkania enalia]|uniref:Uncharacterized protein n=1 Tax=Lojkania enalia TaxID=147567 RepID=A0A9P4KC85_9PLEO|nr:hypothetical protein CC78DRAFT_212373 [Didymosphaeria enalia]
MNSICLIINIIQQVPQSYVLIRCRCKRILSSSHKLFMSRKLLTSKVKFQLSNVLKIFNIIAIRNFAHYRGDNEVFWRIIDTYCRRVAYCTDEILARDCIIRVVAMMKVDSRLIAVGSPRRKLPVRPACGLPLPYLATTPGSIHRNRSNLSTA